MSTSRTTVIVGLDLRSPASPRAVSSFTTNAISQAWQQNNSSSLGGYYDRQFNPGTTNPFDDAAAIETNTSRLQRGGHAEEHYVVAYGTERGSIHYRVYPSIQADGSVSGDSGLSNQGPSGRRPTGAQSAPTVSPLVSMPGAPAGTGTSLVVDMSTAFQGSIVSMVRLSPRPEHITSGGPNAPPPVFVVLVDDHKGAGPQSSAVASGSYASSILALKQGVFQKLGTGTQMPRMSCCAYHPATGFVYAAGTSVLSLPAPLSATISSAFTQQAGGTYAASHYHPTLKYTSPNVLPNPVRSNPGALTLICNGTLAIAAVNHSFYAVPAATSNVCVKVVSLTQSSQVHPAIVLPILSTDNSALLFVGSGRECTTCMVTHSLSKAPSKVGKRTVNAGIHVSAGTGANSLLFEGHEPSSSSTFGSAPSSSSSANVTNDITSLTSPILSAVPVQCGSQTFVAVLTSDGLVQLRHPACIAVPFRTLEVGSRPNNFYYLGVLESSSSEGKGRSAEGRLLSVGYSGDARVILIKGDTPQDQADRLMKLAIDAFGANGFPRADLAEALHASYSSTSYVGPEPSPKTRQLLRQYLEAMLGNGHFSAEEKCDDPPSKSETQDQPHKDLLLLSLLCLISTVLTPPLASLANRAAKAASSRVPSSPAPSTSVKNFVMQITEALLHQATASSHTISLIRTSSAPIVPSYKPSKEENSMDFVEASLWLLRSAGLHEEALQVLQDRMSNTSNVHGGWSVIKYESYAASHLGELWSSNKLETAELVLKTPATRELLESNPELGLSVFISHHPISEKEWIAIGHGGASVVEGDPIYHVIDIRRVVEFLRDMKVSPSGIEESVHMEDGGLEISYQSTLMTSPSIVTEISKLERKPLPLLSGRDLAITFMESALGISTSRPTYSSFDAADDLPLDQEMKNKIVSIHEELAYLLLEGLLSERDGNANMQDDGNSINDELDETRQGKIYRAKLRRLLAWPLFQGRPDRLRSAIPPSFLREQAILLGKMDRHEDALRILYGDLRSLDLALEYCDARYEDEQRRQSLLKKRGIHKSRNNKPCVYLPLVRVALEASHASPQTGEMNDSQRGVDAAIQVLTLRRNVIDRVAALRLLPSSIPLSEVARPFLIPALVESESQVRRYKVAASLLRSRYVELKRALTEAQIASQASLSSVPALRSLSLGSVEPLRSSKAMIVRPASQPVAPYFPGVSLVKHYFPRHLILQAQITNDSPDRRTLADVAFVVAESSSEDSVVPTVNVPVKTLPLRSTGSAWCALEIIPARLEETVLLTCELRFTIMAVDLATGAPLSFSGEGGGGGRTYVEELNDLEVRPKEFMF